MLLSAVQHFAAMLYLSVVVAFSALFLLSAAAPVDPPHANLASRQKRYSGVYMIVGRGSTEAAGEGTPGAVASAVAAQLPNSASVAVNYPASLIDPPYPESVVDGINDAISKVKAYVDACGSSSKIALIGFSQGGNVMTDALAGGVDKPTPLSTAYTKYSKCKQVLTRYSNELMSSTVTAVTVFGDPSYTVAQSFDVGTATRSGVSERYDLAPGHRGPIDLTCSQIFAREPGGASLALLNTYASIVQSYCNANDLFCASGDSDTVHSDEVPDFASAATAFIVAKNS